MNTPAFLPVAATSHVAPGKYRATCTTVHDPKLFRAFSRWYMRIDFAIHDDGSIVSKYVNFGTSKEPNAQLGPRSDYFKLWSLAVGREPKKNEPMDPAKIIGAEFVVTVVEKQRHSGGDYSVVSDLERLSDGGSSLTAQCSLLNAQDSTLNTQDSTLNAQALNRSSSSAAQVRLSEDLHSDHAVQMSTSTGSEQLNRVSAGEQSMNTALQPNDTEPDHAIESVPAMFSSRVQDWGAAMQQLGYAYDGRNYFSEGLTMDPIHAEAMIEMQIKIASYR